MKIKEMGFQEVEMFSLNRDLKTQHFLIKIPKEATY